MYARIGYEIVLNNERTAQKEAELMSADLYPL